MTVGAGSTDSSVSPVASSESGGLVGSAPDAASPTQAAAASRASAPALPQPALQSLALAIAETGEGRTELRLNPDELGLVRMQIRSTDHGITVQILAERADTDSLIRRSLADLGQELRDLGYRDVRFDFGNGGRGQSGGHGTADRTTATAPGGATEPVPETSAPQPRHAATGHLDMRL